MSDKLKNYIRLFVAGFVYTMLITPIVWFAVSILVWDFVEINWVIVRANVLFAIVIGIVFSHDMGKS